MFGFRPEGRRIHDVDPIVAITPYLMPQRCDAQVFLSHDADYEPLMRYIAEKAREGHKITFMELLIASYVRGVSQVPETNRFIMNKQFYNRRELTASFTLLKEQLVDVLSTLTPREEKVLKLRFGIEDGRTRTLEEVGKEFNVTRERIRQIEAKALRKLRHPSRSKKLKDFLN